MGSTLLLAALAWPAVAPNEVDDLPLSGYPMFARERSSVSRFQVVVHVDDEGVEHRLDPHEIADTDQPMQAVMTIRQAIADGTAVELCERIASGAEHGGTIEVVTVTVDSVEWFAGTKEPVDRTVHATCEVEG